MHCAAVGTYFIVKCAIYNLNKNIKEFTYDEACSVSSRVTITIELLSSSTSRSVKIEEELDLASTTSPLLGDLKNEHKFDCLLQNFVFFFLGSSCSLLLEPLIFLLVEMQSCSDF